MKMGFKMTFVSVVVLAIFIVLAVGSSSDDKPDEQASPDQEQVVTSPEKTDDEKEKDAYLAAMVINSSSFSEAFNKFSEQTLNCDYSDEWVIETAVIVLQIKSLIEDARSISPTPDFEDSHNLYMQAMVKFEESMDLFMEGYDNLDAQMIDRAGTLLDEGNVLITQATELMVELNY